MVNEVTVSVPVSPTSVCCGEPFRCSLLHKLNLEHFTSSGLGEEDVGGRCCLWPVSRGYCCRPRRATRRLKWRIFLPYTVCDPFSPVKRLDRASSRDRASNMLRPLPSRPLLDFFTEALPCSFLTASGSDGCGVSLLATGRRKTPNLQFVFHDIW